MAVLTRRVNKENDIASENPPLRVFSGAMRGRIGVAVAVVAGLGILAGCVLDPVDLSAKQCPCADGWVCDRFRNRCVSVEPPDAAPPTDAGRDAAEGGSPLPDGGPGDGGGVTDAFVVVDAGAEDAALDTGPPPDPSACDDALSSAVFCDGFEIALPGPWTSRVELFGSAERVAAPVYRGDGALRGATTATNGQAAMVKHLDALAGDVWVRGYFYFPSSADLSDVSLFYVAERAAPYHGFAVGVQLGGRPWAWVGAPTSVYEIAPAGSEVPRDRWVCFQVHAFVADSGGSAELFVDGTSHVVLSGVDTSPAGGLTYLAAGLERAGTMQPGPVEIFADEIAIGTGPLPCD